MRELTDKCGRLSSELERALETNPPEPITHNEQGLRGSIADRYVDHKRSELLSAIVDLELVRAQLVSLSVLVCTHVVCLLST